MQNAFKTSGSSNKFLKDYEKLFETLTSIGSRFSFLKEGETLFSQDTLDKLNNYRSSVKQL